MRLATIAVALGALVLLWVSPAAVAADSAEPVLEVDLGGGTPTPQPSPVAGVPTAAPTEAPTALPAPASNPVTPTTGSVAPGPVAEAQPRPAPSPTADLKQPFFGKSKPDDDDGLMIIAPGAASPEDSLESFGIDSPFNWKERQSRTLEPSKAADQGGSGDELELSAPDRSDLRDRVKLENSEGVAQPTDRDYDQVERAGGVLNASEYRVDGRIARTKNGGFLARQGAEVALRMEAGRQVYPGSVYIIFREGGLLSTSGEDAHEVGQLVYNLGVLKITRIEGEEVMARVEKQYEAIHEGDLIRLRDPERMRYYATLRQGPSSPPLNLHGEVIGLGFSDLVAQRGGLVYIDLGRAQGVVPGMRLSLSRDAKPVGEDGIRMLQTSGRLGVVRVVNTSRDACVARVEECGGVVRVGDKVGYR